MYGVDVSVDNFIDDEYIDLPYRLEVAREGWPLLREDESPWDHDQWKAWLTLRADTLRAELSAKTVKVLTLTIETSTVVDRLPIYLEALSGLAAAAQRRMVKSIVAESTRQSSSQ